MYTLPDMTQDHFTKYVSFSETLAGCTHGTHDMRGSMMGGVRRGLVGVWVTVCTMFLLLQVKLKIVKLHVQITIVQTD